MRWTWAASEPQVQRRPPRSPPTVLAGMEKERGSGRSINRCVTRDSGGGLLPPGGGGAAPTQTSGGSGAASTCASSSAARQKVSSLSKSPRYSWYIVADGVDVRGREGVDAVVVGAADALAANAGAAAVLGADLAVRRARALPVAVAGQTDAASHIKTLWEGRGRRRGRARLVRVDDGAAAGARLVAGADDAGGELAACAGGGSRAAQHGRRLRRGGGRGGEEAAGGRRRRRRQRGGASGLGRALGSNRRHAAVPRPAIGPGAEEAHQNAAASAKPRAIVS